MYIFFTAARKCQGVPEAARATRRPGGILFKSSSMGCGSGGGMRVGVQEGGRGARDILKGTRREDGVAEPQGRGRSEV